MKALHPSHLLVYLTAVTTVSAACNRDNCLRALVGQSASASTFCSTYTKASNTATTALPTYATACSNLPSRISSACSCLITTATILTTTTTSTTTTPTAPPTCSPSTIIDIQVRNGFFDQIAIPTVGGTRPDMPPWYYRNLVNMTGDFKREDYAVADYNPYGVAAFHFTPQPPAIGLASGTLSTAITFCSGTTYALTFDARNAAYLSQSCTLTASLQNSGLVNTYPATSFSDRFRDFGPVTFRPVRFAQNGEPINADGTYNDVLDFSIRCLGVAGQALPGEGLFEVDRVSVVVNVSPIP